MEESEAPRIALNVQRHQGKDRPDRLSHEKDEKTRDATEEKLHSALRSYVNLRRPQCCELQKAEFLAHKWLASFMSSP